MAAMLLHGAVMILILQMRAPPTPARLPNALSVIVIAPAGYTEAPEPIDTKPKIIAPPKPRPLPDPKPVPPASPVPLPADDIVKEQIQTPLAGPQPNVLQSDKTAEIPGSGLPQKTHIPSRWALKPPLETQRLEGLGFSQSAIECLTSLEPDCQDLRKEVFAEYLLTETQLVWTPDRPDTGMPAEFHGLSEQEILEKLGMNYAGGNAFMILPGISIDGPLWDKLHGVNKTCKIRPNYGNVLDGSAGTIAPRRVCD